MVFCYIKCPKSKTFLAVLPRFWVVQALERLPTWKFEGWQPQEGPRTTQNRGQTSKKVALYMHTI